MNSVSSAPKPTASARDILVENIQTVIVALILAMGIRFIIAQPFRIPSGSMQPTLLVGDYIVVTKWSYGYSRFSFEPLNFGIPKGRLLAHAPQRGDVVVFRPPTHEDKDYVKRLIGMPGDKIQVLDGVLYINGAAVPRTPLGPVAFKDESGDVQQITEFEETLPGGVRYITFDRRRDGDYDRTPVYEVPAGHYFFMGDDRDLSEDSRSADVGFVPFDHLVGKARFVALSFDPTETHVFQPWTWITGMRGERFLKQTP